MLQINKKSFYTMLFLATTICIFASGAYAETSKAELDSDSNIALNRLLQSNPKAAEISKDAKAVLIFPNIVKAGLIFGGAYGEGILQQDSKVDGYYNSITASWGLQLGAQSYGYVVFLMDDKAVNYIHKTNGWEIGVDPTLVLINEGVSKNLSTSTLKGDAYSFTFDQQGLMGGVSLEGTKITKVKK